MHSKRPIMPRVSSFNPVVSPPRHIYRSCQSPTRTIVIDGDREPLPVVFEVRGPTIELQPGEFLRLVVRGPQDAELTIGVGRNGISVFRHPDMVVDVYGPDGDIVEMEGFT